MTMTGTTEYTMLEQFREIQERRASEDLKEAVQRVAAAIVAGKVTMEDIQQAVERKQLPRFVSRVL